MLSLIKNNLKNKHRHNLIKHITRDRKYYCKLSLTKSLRIYKENLNSLKQLSPILLEECPWNKLKDNNIFYCR